MPSELVSVLVGVVGSVAVGHVACLMVEFFRRVAR